MEKVVLEACYKLRFNFQVFFTGIAMYSFTFPIQKKKKIEKYL